MIYVHNNPGKLEYNSLLYVLIRQWNCPELPNHTFKSDTWFKVPCIRTDAGGNTSFTPVHSRIAYASIMSVTEDGVVIKSIQGSGYSGKLGPADFQELARHSFSIPDWEKLHNAPFPYADMFDSAKVNARYREIKGADSSAYFSKDSSNPLFKVIAAKTSPKPCNCGKPVVIK